MLSRLGSNALRIAKSTSSAYDDPPFATGLPHYGHILARGFKVMPYSTGCKTPLSNFEAGQNYKDVLDPEIMVTFPVIGDQDNAGLVHGLPLPGLFSCFVCHCKCVYLKVRNNNTRVYVVAESRLSSFPTDKPQANLTNGTTGGTKKAKGAKPDTMPEDSYQVLEKFNGASLVGKKYEPLFDYFNDFSSVAFRVVADDYVTNDSGTGVVHVLCLW